MADLSSIDLSFQNFCLEKLDVWNEEHVSILKEFRDDDALDMCYDVLVDIELGREYSSQDDNLYLAKNSDGYFGYLCITNSIDGNRELAYIVQDKVRRKGLGTIMLNTVSNFLLDEDVNTSNIFLQISPNNDAGIKLATKCGFLEVIPSRYDHYDTYEKKLVNKG